MQAAGFQLKVTVRAGRAGAGGSEAEVLADLDGRDKELLLERGAEVLKALSIWRFARCGWSRPTTKKFISIAAAIARCVLKSCA